MEAGQRLLTSAGVRGHCVDAALFGGGVDSYHQRSERSFSPGLTARVPKNPLTSIPHLVPRTFGI